MNITNEQLIRDMMVRIGNSDTTTEALMFYQFAAPLLIDCKVVLASKDGATPGFAINKTFSAGASIRSLFKTNRVLVLDKDTMREMSSGKATYPIDYSISLDTQALSYLTPHLQGKVAGIPKDFTEVFSFIARDDVFVDPIPYMLENLHNLTDQENTNKILEKLKAYEVLRNIDTAWLASHGEVRSTLSPSEIEEGAKKLLDDMHRDRANTEFMGQVTFWHQFEYCQLLKMASIQLKSPSLSINAKIEKYSEFCDARLATMCGRETAVAKAYFESGQNLEFFGKIQKKKPDLFAALDNMAWDMWHVRQLEKAMTLRPNNNARYFFPALLTFDKRFVEIMDLYPLKACVFKAGDFEPMPFYDGDWFDLVATDVEKKDAFVQRFYSDEAQASRVSRRASARIEMPAIIAELESELALIAGVKKL